MAVDPPRWDDEELTILPQTPAPPRPAAAPDVDETQLSWSAPPARPAGVAAEAGAANPGESPAVAEPAAEPDEDDDVTLLHRPDEGDDDDDDGHTVVLGRRTRGSFDELAWLVVIRTPSARRGEMYRLSDERMGIGRVPSNAICLNDGAISEQHAALRYQPETGEFLLHDLASANGTKVNGTIVGAPVALKDGDTIELGQTSLVFKRV